MKVEVWSDVVCPWCYIGKRRFERALADFEGAGEVELTWRSFELNPTHPRGERRRLDEHLASRTGRSVEDVQAMNGRVTELAAAEGLDYHLERYTVVNTFDAHRVAHLGTELGVGDAIQERLLRAQLVEGEVLDDPETLVRVAGEAAVPEAEVRRVLESDAYADAVRADERDAAMLGINGVPFFVLDRRYGISGAQSPEVFLDALRMASDAAA